MTGYANSASFPQIMDCMINEAQVGTMVVASAGADSQAEQVISLRERSAKVLFSCGPAVATPRPGWRSSKVPVFPVLRTRYHGPRSAALARLPHLAGWPHGGWFWQCPALTAGRSTPRPACGVSAGDPVESRNN